MKPSFTLAGKHNIASILDMMETFYAIDAYPFDRSLTEKNLYTLVQTPSIGNAWLITIDNEDIGYVVLIRGFSFEHGGLDAFIDELFVKSPFRGKGIGYEALNFVMQEAAKLEINAVHLEVERHNEAGKKIYQKFGFKESPRSMMSMPVKASANSH